MGKFGTLSVLEDLASWTNESVINNETEVAQRVSDALAVHNALFEDMASDYASFTNQPQMAYGGASAAIIQELDEWGAADASKASNYGNLCIPLRIYDIARPGDLRRIVHGKAIGTLVHGRGSSAST